MVVVTEAFAFISPCIQGNTFVKNARKMAQARARI
jgi:hypothetical protein